MPTNVVFNGTSLQSMSGDVGIMAHVIEHDQLPTRRLNQMNSARSDGSKLTGSFFDKKTIKVEGKIIGSGPADCDARIDALHQALAAQEAQLDIDWAGGTRRYIATVANTILSRPPAANFATFSIEFTCSNAYGQDTTSSSFLGSTAVTTSPTTPSITPGGTALVQRPIFTATLTSGTGLTSNKTITISNPATSVAISITRNWTAGDVLVVDCEQMKCTVNGTIVDYTGMFPTWAPGPGSVRWADNFTTRSVSLAGVFTPRYL